MYKRNDRAEWFKKRAGTSYSEEFGIWIVCEHVTKEYLQKYAELFPADFCYVEGALYSLDMKVAYAYAANGDSVWKIPDSVEVFDNIFFSGNCEEYYSLEEVYIGENLKEIIDIYGCFGMRLQKVQVSAKNKYFASVNGCLYSKDKMELIYYPPEHAKGRFSVRKGTKKIRKDAVVVEMLPSKFIIPDTVETLEKDWLDEQYDKGFLMTREEVSRATVLNVPLHLKKDIQATWNDDAYTRPTVIYK
jgi:hypothetical protein